MRGGTIALAIALALLAGVAIYRGVSGGSGDPVAASNSALPGSIEELQARTQADPGDATAWQMLGYAHFDRDEFAAAAQAYRKAADLTPDRAVLWSSLGEALVLASQSDPMPPEALSAFQKAFRIDPVDPRARYFLAVKRDLDGDHKGAIDAWLALLGDTPHGAVWEEDLVRTIEQVGAINKIEVAVDLAAARERQPLPAASPAMPGPSAEDLAAATAIPPSEQQEMARNMVERLEARLELEPKNVEGWIMLMRSRMTLGEPDKARTALAAAIAANPAQRGELQRAASELGIR